MASMGFAKLTMPLRASVGNGEVVLSPDHANAVATCAHRVTRITACLPLIGPLAHSALPGKLMPICGAKLVSWHGYGRQGECYTPGP